MEVGDIQKAVKHMLEEYDKIRGKDVHELGITFWDLVVLTARDEAQRQAYMVQIKNKLQWGELPRGVKYLVYADPPGPKIGCGGCTLYVLHALRQEYGDALYNMRVLLINAGGYSQRLPSTSALGKVFMALPSDKAQMYQLLDYKLACFSTFLSNMKPGVFHAASDTIEAFDIGTGSSCDFTREGFTAIAHPNMLHIGESHGVFVLDGKPQTGDDSGVVPLTEKLSCLEVLQKPSSDLMRERGAVVCTKSTQEEIVYTDSCYFYDHTVTKKFIAFYEKEGPFDCELDSYGDFFQPLGQNATNDYVYNLSKVVNVAASLVPTRMKMFDLLKGTPLNVLVLNASKFYHLGTTKEYLHHFCADPMFGKELNVTREVFCAFPSVDHEGEPQKVRESHHEGIHMHSIIPYSSVIASTSIVEYCHFAVPLSVQDNCIVSNCAVSDDHTEISELNVPADMFVHTLPVESPHGYCTILFNIHDNIKQRVTGVGDVSRMTYLGKPLAVYLKALGLANEDVLDASALDMLSLWEINLFPVCPTMGESFLAALDIIKAVHTEDVMEGKERIVALPRFSMAEILRKKNIEDMLNYRHDLYSCIVTIRHHMPE